MKATLFLIALATGGAALAQTEMQTSTTGGQMSAPGNTAPERDARGIPVVSDPATVPAGWNEAPRPGGTGAPPSATPAPMGSEAHPPCSRTVTDNCVQTYEGGSRRRRR